LRVRHLAVSGCLVAALTFGVAACGGSSKKDSGTGGSSSSTGSTTLTIYSSLPLRGDSRVRSESVINGEKLALQELGGRVGKFTIKYVSVDDSTASEGKWDPGETSGNARKAVQDKSTIAYLGDLNSGASAISTPILNEAGVLQISPASTAVGLTRAEGADKGEPDKYYPSGKRTFGRVVPADHIQAAAQVRYQKDNGCTKTYIVNDREVYGAGLATQVVNFAKAQGLEIAGNDRIDPKAANYLAVATKISGTGADCVFFGGSVENNAVRLWKDLHAAMPTVKLFGPEGVATAAFTEKIGTAAEKVTYLTSPTLDPKLYPRSGQKFFADYRAKFSGDPDPYAIYGYEAMKVALQAIQNAGDKGNDRQAVIDAFFAIKERDSVLGKYSIDQNGDTTLSDYGGYRVRGGKLAFDQVIRPTQA
jgi:branched-chain amino acid transport system substrate-binding protein